LHGKGVLLHSGMMNCLLMTSCRGNFNGFDADSR
jgi:hypothetical protein